MAREEPLSRSDERELLRIARATLREYVRSGRTPPGKPHREGLLQYGDVAARLEGRGMARSFLCRGKATPLYRGVQRAVEAAARGGFEELPPVAEWELDALAIEIALIREIRPIADPSEIRMGEHGLAVAALGRKALVLPETAPGGLTAAAFWHRGLERAGADEVEHLAVEVFSARIIGE